MQNEMLAILAYCTAVSKQTKCKNSCGLQIRQIYIQLTTLCRWY